MAAELESAAGSYRSVIAGLAGDSWQGPASVAMAAAAAPYAAWMSSTAAQAGQAATQAKAAAAAYETAFAMTVPPPVIAANRAQLAALVATNFLGQNTPAIAANEAHYGEMWAQDAAAMYGYAGSAAAATDLTSFTPPKQNTNPGGLGNQAASVLQTAGTSAGTHAQTAASQLAGVPQTLQGLSQPGLTQMAAIAPALAPESGGGGISTGLLIDVGATVFELLTVLPFGAVSIGGAFGGLAITLAALAFPEEIEGGLGLGGLGGLGLIGDVAPAGGLGGLTPMAGLGGAGGTGATWASMGKAASLGSLSVPQAWAAAAPSAFREVALVSAESTAGAASAAAAGGSEIPFAEMALAGMAGRAMAGSAGQGARERPGTTTPDRPAAPSQPPEDPTTPDGPVTAVEIVAELRGLAELRDSGVLTEEEFNKQRERLVEV
jgi:PPE-repeat protein